MVRGPPIKLKLRQNHLQKFGQKLGNLHQKTKNLKSVRQLVSNYDLKIINLNHHFKTGLFRISTFGTIYCIMVLFAQNVNKLHKHLNTCITTNEIYKKKNNRHS